MTHSIDIFVAAAAAVADGIAMTPRSANDKEYFPQDWFADRVSGLGLPFHAQGRNSYPDGRAITASALRSYTVHLDGQTPATKRQDRRPDAGRQREFAVFEAG